MKRSIGVIDLDAIPPVDENELMDILRRDVAGLPEEDREEILEIARDLFSDEELHEMFSGDFAKMCP